jgi:hypothetical protein
MSLLVIALDFILLEHSLSPARSLAPSPRAADQTINENIHWLAPLCEGKKVSLLTRHRE